MKLAVDCRMLDSGGIGTYFESVLPFLLENFECTLFGKIELISKYKAQADSIFDCSCKTFSLQELFSFPKNILKEINCCDAFYSPYCNVPGGIKVPVFTTIHDVVFLDVPGLSSKTGTIIRKWFYQRAVNRSKTVFTVSKFSEERIKANLKTRKTPVVVTYNSVPAWFVKPDSTIQKNNTIMFVGNIKKHKGLHTLLQAFKALSEKGFDGKLLIVGNAANFRSGDSEIFTEIQALPQNTVEFTGKITDEQLKTLYSTSRLLIQPSLYEGFGMPPMEALTMGTNVVLSDIPVFREIYKDFPVSFFKVSDFKDLAQKILENYNKPSPSSLPEKYSFEKTSKIIINTIKGE